MNDNLFQTFDNNTSLTYLRIVKPGSLVSALIGDSVSVIIEGEIFSSIQRILHMSNRDLKLQDDNARTASNT